MELLLAAFLLAWGGVSAEHPNMTFEQLAQASLDSKKRRCTADTVKRQPRKPIEAGKQAGPSTRCSQG